VKKSINSDWVGAWIILCKRKLIFYNDQDSIQIALDLRKARYIGLRQSDESVNLQINEKGLTLLVDCPWKNELLSVYFIFPSVKEAKIWNAAVKSEAHKNGDNVKKQQLTRVIYFYCLP
jgi:hypothetical protein